MYTNSKISILFVCLLIPFFYSCYKKESNEIEFRFEAKVIGKGIDCGDTFLIDLRNLSDDSEFENSIYYAFNLPSEFKVADLEIKLNCRLPNINEAVACTHLGPDFPHLIVIECDYLNKLKSRNANKGWVSVGLDLGN
jgi:hypothetical protein